MWVYYVWVAPRIIRAEFKEFLDKKDKSWLDNYLVIYHKSKEPDADWEHQYTIGLYKQVVWLPVVGEERLNEILDFAKEYEKVTIVDWNGDEIESSF